MVFYLIVLVNVERISLIVVPDLAFEALESSDDNFRIKIELVQMHPPIK